MKPSLFCFFAFTFPLLLQGEGQAVTEAPPKRNVIATFRVTVKAGHEADFRAALAIQLRSFQPGDFAWHVGKVISGPEGNSYEIVEGPFSWTQFGQRRGSANSSREHFAEILTPHIEKTSPTTFAILENGMSNSTRLTWPAQVVVVRYWVKPGRGMEAADILKAYRQANIKRGFTFVVWHSIYSGESVYDLVYELASGWKELDVDRLGIKEAFDDMGGKGEYERQQAKIAQTFQSITNEMIEYLPDLEVGALP